MKIQVLVGMIASGKTSYCKNAAKEEILCITDDAIVNMLHGNNYELYDKDLKVLYKSIENHIIAQALCLKRTVLIDRGLNISKAGRARYIALAKSFDVPIEAITFKNSGAEIHAKRRYNNDNRELDYNFWLGAAKRHDKDWQYPTLDEGFNRVLPIEFDDIQKGKVFI